VILYIPNPYINANSTQVTGLELESHYKWKLGDFGSLYSSLDWSHAMSFILTQDGTSYQLAGTHGPSIVGGNTGNPKDRIQATFSWDKGPWDVTTAFNWISSYSVTDPSLAGSTTCQDALSNQSPYFTSVPTNFCTIGSFLTTELTVRYQYSKNLTVHLAVNNLFDRQPPIDLSTYGGGLLPYNPSLHQEGAVGRFYQAGLTYSF
jgi:iron complex outermembrane recepter protein